MGRDLLLSLAVAFSAMLGGVAIAQDKQTDYRLGAGDAIRVMVFQNPDLTVETRVAESGAITYPLIGQTDVGGLTIDAAEKKIASALKAGGFVQQPQVNIVLLQNRGNQVAVLGQVGRPGRFPLETFNIKVSEMLAIAGGILSGGSDIAILTGTRGGKPFRKEIDIPALFLESKGAEDPILQGGDVIYVHRAPVFYVYGEAQRPGSYRIERAMTVQQALSLGGGPTPRGTELWLRIHRRNADGIIQQIAPERHDPVLPDDVIYVRESIF